MESSACSRGSTLHLEIILQLNPCKVILTSVYFNIFHEYFLLNCREFIRLALFPQEKNKQSYASLGLLSVFFDS